MSNVVFGPWLFLELLLTKIPTHAWRMFFLGPRHIGHFGEQRSNWCSNLICGFFNNLLQSSQLITCYSHHYYNESRPFHVSKRKGQRQIVFIQSLLNLLTMCLCTLTRNILTPSQVVWCIFGVRIYIPKICKNKHFRIPI